VTPDNVHLTQDGGCEIYALKLKPMLEKLLVKQCIAFTAQPLMAKTL
jgi:hypothetical protein